ncbi:crotonase/enoyl-CoA hydratase family protein [Pseudonocardia sp. ICBG1122]|jgi:enoyl-CoA hydratase|nr:crotonase/enoyl-CoA hydratase family protein [Pseudonocardia sp. AL041005-10]ALE78238.1 enoyl-CoA hydratase [Pseudonocardia sp. AL041005-10]NWJ69002.1 crotonase/enoyl-CoA hydratase family protein [Pseudonocardia pini]NWJ70648.1 crotonase/enoyl-CoA hydratase family protein [Pseudonocardia pini]
MTEQSELTPSGPAASEEEVLVERRDGVLLITVNRPRAKNALNENVARSVAAAVDELDADPDLRVGVLTGAGGVFSAGMDLKAFLRGERPSLPGRGLCGITQRPPVTPMIAAVEGWALAGGFEIMLACDLVVAGRGARFGVPEVKRSLVAAAGGALELANRVPRALALEMLLTGDPIDATRAEAAGLVNRVVDDGGALDAALELAGRIAVNGPLGLAASKRIVRESPDWGADRWERHDAVVGPVLTSEDAREGATAFAEKRDPVWRGR